jgi:hypothetical protein
MNIKSLCLAALLPMFSSCGIIYYGVTTRGTMVSQGTITDCGAFTFRVFDEHLRVASERYGPDSLQVYPDYGPRERRDSLFLAAKSDQFRTSDFGSEMIGIDPSHLSIWRNSCDVRGDFRGEEVFTGTIPRIASTSGKVTIIKQPEYHFAGQIKIIGTNRYLLLHLEANDFLDPTFHRARVMKSFEKFRSSIKAK